MLRIITISKQLIRFQQRSYFGGCGILCISCIKIKIRLRRIINIDFNLTGIVQVRLHIVYVSLII